MSPPSPPPCLHLPQFVFFFLLARRAALSPVSPISCSHLLSPLHVCPSPLFSSVSTVREIGFVAWQCPVRNAACFVACAGQSPLVPSRFPHTRVVLFDLRSHAACHHRCLLCLSPPPPHISYVSVLYCPFTATVSCARSLFVLVVSFPSIASLRFSHHLIISVLSAKLRKPRSDFLPLSVIVTEWSALLWLVPHLVRGFHRTFFLHRQRQHQELALGLHSLPPPSDTHVHAAPVDLCKRQFV